ncbi:MAG: magnesium transporter [Alphaproteobacteria bacterium]|nr:magnesium transporter [Alphaproteobacteria bacterium]
MTDAQGPAPEERDELEGLYGATEAVVREIRKALAENHPEAVGELVRPFHAADLADLFEQLNTEERAMLVSLVGTDVDPEFFSYLDYAVREDVIDDLDTEQLATVVQELDTDDAIDLIEDLDAEDQAELLQAIPAEDRALYEDALRYPEDSAARLMNREVATVPSFWSVGQTIDYMRSDAELPSTFYDIYIIDPSHRPIGALPVSRLLRTDRPVPVSEIMSTDLKIIPATMDQEDVAFLFRQYGLASAPVVDDSDRLIGVITVDDVVDVIEEEHEEDILKLGGVSEDDLYHAVVGTTLARFPWLLLNLATAFIAANVIGLFDASIEKVVALAVLMPIVASMGGNAGTQTLTIAVRALAVKELTPANALRIIFKEVFVGSINGVVFAILVGLAAWLWFGNPLIGAVIGAAMIINLMVAALAGILIPLTMDKIGADPAVGSSVFVTTITDVVGFFSFLGLATIVLL